MLGIRGTKTWLLSGALMALVAVGCAAPDRRTFEPGVEHVPGPASVWLTSEPAAPQAPVLVTMRSPADPGLLFQHTFVPGATLRGSFATSQGEYRLAALGGACALDLALGPSQVAEVVLALEDGGCSMAVRRVGSMDDPAMWKDDPAVLITNHGAGNTEPLDETRPGAS